MESQSARPGLHRRLIWVALAILAGLSWTSDAHSASLSGRAYAALVNAPAMGAGPMYVADTGNLASDGGWQGAGMTCTRVPKIFRAEKLVATTGGSADYVSSSTSLTKALILPGHPAQLAASLVRAETATTHGGSRGSTEIRGLRLGGRAVSVTGEPNQTVRIPGVATLFINEQRIVPGGIAVNALRLRLATGDEIIVSSAKSAIGQRPVGSVKPFASFFFVPVASRSDGCNGGIMRPARLHWSANDSGSRWF